MQRCRWSLAAKGLQIILWSGIRLPILSENNAGGASGHFGFRPGSG